MGETITKDENNVDVDNKEKINNNTILSGFKDEEEDFTEDEYYILYNFFVTYSLANTQSFKKRELTYYGWKKTGISKSGVTSKIKNILNLYNNKNFIFIKSKDYGNKLLNEAASLNLKRNNLDKDFIREIGVMTNCTDNHYYSLFSHIRNCLAHGRFVLKKNKNKERILILEDKTPGKGGKITARIIIKLNTIFKIISIIDKNDILKIKEKGIIADEAPTNIIPLEREQQMYGT